MNRTQNQNVFPTFQVWNYCAFQKHAKTEVKSRLQNYVFRCRQSYLRSQATNLETQKHTQLIEIYQSQITIRDLLNPFPKRSAKMIDGNEKRKRQLAFELQNLRVYEKRSNL